MIPITPELALAIFNFAMRLKNDIQAKHAAQGQVLTDEQVRAKLEADAAGVLDEIAAWRAAHPET